MRDKIVFFVLGAVLATIAYLVGDLETLTAENKITELDHLRVNRLHVTGSMGVGDTGKKAILITVDNESAKIILSGGEWPKGYDGILRVDNSPTISLRVTGSIASIGAASHSERPEATSILTVANTEGKKFESGIVLDDSNGTKVIFSDSN